MSQNNLNINDFIDALKSSPSIIPILFNLRDEHKHPRYPAVFIHDDILTNWSISSEVEELMQSSLLSLNAKQHVLSFVLWLLRPVVYTIDHKKITSEYNISTIDIPLILNKPKMLAYLFSIDNYYGLHNITVLIRPIEFTNIKNLHGEYEFSIYIFIQEGINTKVIDKRRRIVLPFLVTKLSAKKFSKYIDLLVRKDLKSNKPVYMQNATREREFLSSILTMCFSYMSTACSTTNETDLSFNHCYERKLNQHTTEFAFPDKVVFKDIAGKTLPNRDINIWSTTTRNQYTPEVEPRQPHLRSGFTKRVWVGKRGSPERHMELRHIKPTVVNKHLLEVTKKE